MRVTLYLSTVTLQYATGLTSVGLLQLLVLLFLWLLTCSYCQAPTLLKLCDTGFQASVAVKSSAEHMSHAWMILCRT